MKMGDRSREVAKDFICPTKSLNIISGGFNERR